MADHPQAPLIRPLLAVALILSPVLSPADTDAAQEGTRESTVSARVTGMVTETGTGAPLAGVRVRVGEIGPGATTDARGRFVLPRVPAAEPGAEGTVILSFERLGFAPLSHEITIREGEDLLVEVTLEARALRLDPVSVLHERTRMVGDPAGARSIPGSAFHLSRHDLDRRHLAVDNVHDVLRQIPGVQVTDEDGYGLRPNIGLRGTGTERSSNITLMEDGVLIAPAPYAAPAAYYFPSVGRMDGVEVRTGASQIRYGPRTLGGALNLITAPIPEGRQVRAEAAGGSNDLLRGHLRIGDSSTHLGWLVEGYSVRTDGFKRLPGREDTGFDQRDFLGKLRISSDRNASTYQEMELKFGHSNHRSDETYLGLTDEDFRSQSLLRYPASAEDVMAAEHRQLQLRYFVQPSQHTDVVVTAYRNAFSRSWYKLQSVDGVSISNVLSSPEAHLQHLSILQGADSGDDALFLRANNRTYLSQGVQATFGLRAEGPGSTHHNLELGVRLHRDDEDRLQWEDGYRMEGGHLLQTSQGAPGSQANRLNRATALALHIQDELRFGRWTAVPGVRFETIDFARRDWAPTDPDRTGAVSERTNSVSALVPGLGVSYEWSPRTTFFGGVHRGFGPPGPGAAEETRVENSTNYELGLRVRQGALGLNLTTFFSDYSNILGQSTLATGGSGVGNLHNGGAVHVAGIEAAVDADLGRRFGLPVALPIRSTYTWTRGTFETDFESDFGPWGTVAAGDRVPYMAEHLVSGTFGVEDPSWAVSLGWNMSSAMRTEAGRGSIPDGSGVPSFVVFNLSGEVGLGRGLTTYAAVQNITDERYIVARRPAGVRPGLPRTFFVGMRFAP